MDLLLEVLDDFSNLRSQLIVRRAVQRKEAREMNVVGSAAGDERFQSLRPSQQL
jgi:hypothetical protein